MVLLVIAMVPVVWGLIIDQSPQLITATAITLLLQILVLLLYISLRRFVLIVKELREEMDALKGRKK